LHDSDYIEKAGKILERLIAEYKWHPSVIAWGLGTGFDASDMRTQRFLQKLAEIAKRLDSRPVYAGVRGEFHPALPLDWQIVDCRGGQDNPVIAENDRVIWRCTVLSQGKDPETSERDQASVLKKTLQVKLGTGKGLIVGPLRDWCGDRPHTYRGPGEDSHVFSAGLVKRSGSDRPSFDVVRSLFSGSAGPTIAPFEKNDTDTDIFLMAGLVVLLTFLLIFRTDRRLRKYLRRVFFYPHGFYSDIGENRYVLTSLTLIVGLCYCCSIAIILSSLAYYMRQNMYFDEILSWCFSNARTKAKIIWLIWHPLAFILTTTLVLMTVASLQALFLKLSVLLRGRNVKWRNIFVFVFWVPSHLLFSMPLAILFYRFLDNPDLVTFSAIYGGTLILWFFIRSYKGIKVLLQLSAIRSAVFCGFMFLGTSLAIFVWLETTRSLLDYSQYYLSILTK
jgi:hypothetical protein